MATISRPQLVVHNALNGTEITHTTLQLTRTATMVQGTLLKADQAEASATELAALTYDVGFVIDDQDFEDVVVGQTYHVRCVRRPDLVIMVGALIKLGSTPVDAGELALFQSGSNAVTA